MGAPLYLDAFNIEDKNEWGPRVEAYFKNQSLGKLGYDRGDIFYKKVGGNCLAFLHYFTEEELISLITECGFEIKELHYIGYIQKSGELVKDKTEGFFFVKAIKASEV